jgi:hypothetical protein
LGKDTTEMDLWSFEDDLELDETAQKPSIVQSPRSSAGEIPEPRERRVTKAREPGNPLEGTPPSTGAGRIQMNVNRTRPIGQPSAPPTGLSRTESEFDDLEYWDDVPKGPQIDDLPAPTTLEPVPETSPPEPVEPSPPEPAVISSQPIAEADDDEFSPARPKEAKPLTLTPHLLMSKAERIGLMVLIGLLGAGGLATVVYSLKRLPTESSQAKIIDFPVKGTLIEVDSAVTYWRAPITDGPSPETVRRGTKLLPVLEMQISGGTGALRVLFRDEERTAVGDAVTHVIRGSGTVIIPATAGFDDLGMHAAYRTGGSKPWIIEVFEAASETSPGKDFKRLFEMKISTDRR